MRAPMLTAPKPVSLGVRTCRECRATERSRNAIANILYQQNLGQRRDKVFASREVGISISSRYEKATPLLTGSYCLCINRVSSTVIVEEV